jgi:hypoxanthine phosphoribosyltransferase
MARPAAGPTWTAPGASGSGTGPVSPRAGRPGPLSLDDVAPPDRPAPSFAHASEAEMARILDFYRIRWEYEPHTFPILWNLDGTVVESFSPDFWLPDLELYLEMTTLRQKLVRKKNRKLRRIRELYPDIRVKLFYARDFRALMLKFGRLAMADALSGTSGQVVPERDLAAIALIDADDETDPGVVPDRGDSIEPAGRP